MVTYTAIWDRKGIVLSQLLYASWREGILQKRKNMSKAPIFGICKWEKWWNKLEIEVEDKFHSAVFIEIKLCNWESLWDECSYTSAYTNDSDKVHGFVLKYLHI